MLKIMVIDNNYIRKLYIFIIYLVKINKFFNLFYIQYLFYDFYRKFY